MNINRYLWWFTTKIYDDNKSLLKRKILCLLQHSKIFNCWSDFYCCNLYFWNISCFGEQVLGKVGTVIEKSKNCTRTLQNIFVSWKRTLKDFKNVKSELKEMFFPVDIRCFLAGSFSYHPFPMRFANLNDTYQWVHFSMRCNVLHHPKSDPHEDLNQRKSECLFAMN